MARASISGFAERLRRRSVAPSALAAALVMSLGVGIGPTSAAEDGVRFGSRVAARGGESPNQAVLNMESRIGRRYDDIRIFKLWNDPWPDSHAQWLADRGYTVLLSVKSLRSNGGTILWRDIAAAGPGDPLYQDMVGWANKVKNYEGQVYFTFNHEPEASASSTMGDATEFKAAWVKFISIMREQNVTNAKYLWIMTDHAFRVGSRDRRQAIKWYPGDQYVDGIASDSYNWYTCRGRDERWRSLEAIVTPMRNFGAQHPDEELWLAEWASAEDPAQPGRKAQWFRDARELFKKPGWEQFEGVVYFNYPGQRNCNWFVDSSESSLTAYREMAQDPFYGGPSVGEEPEPEPEPDPQVPPADGEVMFVVGNAAAPAAADAAIRDRLTAAGHSVELVDDGVVTATAANGADAVLVSATVGTSLGRRLRSVASPLVMWKPYLYDDMRLTGTVAGTDYGNVSTRTAVVTAAGHPLAAGRAGTVAIHSTSRTVAYGNPGPAATVVATVRGRGGLFVYEDAAELPGGGTAAGCRIGFPAGGSSATALTADGWALVEAAVEYAAGGCAG